MKKIFLFACFVLIWGIGFLSATYQIFPYHEIREIKNFISSKQVPTFSTYYHDKVSFFNEFKLPTDIVMVGDSITDGAEWHIMFPNLKIANYGIGGDTTDGLLNRIDQICLLKPKKLFIMIGINDFSRYKSVESVYINYTEIIKNLKECGVTPYIQSTILAGSKRKNLNASITDLNKKLDDYCKENDTFFIDLNSKLSPEGYLNSKFTLDDVHLNAEGYKVWKNILENYIF